jgi:hypothetical protein
VLQFIAWRTLQHRSNLKDLDTMAFDAVTEIDFATDVWSGSLVLNECPDGSMHMRQLEFAQRHLADA